MYVIEIRTYNYLFFVKLGVINHSFQHESIYLCLRQRIGAFLLHWILGRHYQKWRGEFKGRITNGNLLFLHGFQQGRLYFGRGAVNFIRQYKVCKNWPFFYREIILLNIVDHRTHNIGRQQIRGELYPTKNTFYRLTQRIDSESFSQAWNSL